jgi:hypothetical protein
MSDDAEQKLKQTIIDKYLAAEPTPETSTEIVKDIAEELDQSPNKVRMLLVNAHVYVKKDATATANKEGGAKKSTGEGTKRVSKESQIAALKAAITAKGASVDDDILDKLTGKAAAYFTTVLGSK